jgi:hypothetical protein
MLPVVRRLSLTRARVGGGNLKNIKSKEKSKPKPDVGVANISLDPF